MIAINIWTKVEKPISVVDKVYQILYFLLCSIVNEVNATVIAIRTPKKPIASAQLNNMLIWSNFICLEISNAYTNYNILFGV